MNKKKQNKKVTEDKPCRCHGTFRVEEPDGTIHTCYECLKEGKIQ